MDFCVCASARSGRALGQETMLSQIDFATHYVTKRKQKVTKMLMRNSFRRNSFRQNGVRQNCFQA